MNLKLADGDIESTMEDLKYLGHLGVDGIGHFLRMTVGIQCISIHLQTSNLQGDIYKVIKSKTLWNLI